jgi:hypothetical protein
MRLDGGAVRQGLYGEAELNPGIDIPGSPEVGYNTGVNAREFRLFLLLSAIRGQNNRD